MFNYHGSFYLAVVRMALPPVVLVRRLPYWDVSEMATVRSVAEEEAKWVSAAVGIQPAASSEAVVKNAPCIEPARETTTTSFSAL